MEQLQTEFIHTYTNSKHFLVRECLFKARTVTCTKPDLKPHAIWCKLHMCTRKLGEMGDIVTHWFTRSKRIKACFAFFYILYIKISGLSIINSDLQNTSIPGNFSCTFSSALSRNQARFSFSRFFWALSRHAPHFKQHRTHASARARWPFFNAHRWRWSKNKHELCHVLVTHYKCPLKYHMLLWFTTVITMKKRNYRCHA